MSSTEVEVVAGTRSLKVPRRKLRPDLPADDKYVVKCDVTDPTFDQFTKVVRGEFVAFDSDLRSLINELGFENKVTLRNEISELRKIVESSETTIADLRQELASIKAEVASFENFDSKIRDCEVRLARDMEAEMAFTKNELDSLKAAVLAIRSRSSFPVPGRVGLSSSMSISRSMPRITDTEKRNSKEFSFTGNAFNGVIAYLTSEFGGNVVDQEVVNVTARDGSGMKYIFEFDDVESNYCSKNLPDAWFCIDFIKRRVVPSNYTFRTYAFGGKNYFHPKSWVVEISMDGAEWITVDRRIDNQDLNGASKMKTFPISREKTDECRYIRVKSVGPNHNGKNHLVCAGFEIFGVLYE